ncbi:unnamed protein product [Rodentolepis nana]|uniref:Uncharacterized protein n=1 Tax=Rodentolepis nana TaxID=102285 RepID=A0A0R3T013_RODNA|nr:unnamed protein product [Rodentolepis nana]
MWLSVLANRCRGDVDKRGIEGDDVEAHFSPHRVIKMGSGILAVMMAHDADDKISTNYHTFHDGSAEQMPPNREERKCEKETCFPSPLMPFDFCG